MIVILRVRSGLDAVRWLNQRQQWVGRIVCAAHFAPLSLLCGLWRGDGGGGSRN